MSMRVLATATVIGLTACGSTTVEPEEPRTNASENETAAAVDAAAATTPTPPRDGPPAQPSDAGAGDDDQARLAARFVAAITSCDVRARCCPHLTEPRAACEAGMARQREMWRTAIRDSRLHASGAARFDPMAVAELEANVAACVPLLEAPWFLNSLIIGTVPRDGSCGDGNLIDTAACVESLFCVPLGPQLFCGPGSMPVRREPPTRESTYCRPFDE